jgi:prepilin-type N-terminal cleavage/methylation domain-containing protein/prepilin-type processing-associated H-X9-DG protein
MKVSSYRRTPRKNAAFTLIELLVVIAIIAILAAILFPVFAKAREKARQASCLSNEKQIGLALLQYEQDYDERLPFFWYGADGAASDQTLNPQKYKWMDACYPYVKSEGVFNCPDDATTYNYKYYKTLAAGSNLHYGSYGMNVMYRYDGGPRNPPSGQSIAGIVNPATTVWVGEIVGGPDAEGFGWTTLANQPNPVVNTAVTPNKIDALVQRHTDNANVLWCDGHAKAVNMNFLASKVAADGKTLSYFTIQDD